MPKEPRGKDYKYMLRLPEHLGRALREQAKAEDRPISRVITRALTTYLSTSDRVLDHGSI